MPAVMAKLTAERRRSESHRCTDTPLCPVGIGRSGAERETPADVKGCALLGGGLKGRVSAVIQERGPSVLTATPPFRVMIVT
ncbi:hypothetical protein GCM10023324_19670 [Streptomyces youssoufiensis]